MTIEELKKGDWVVHQQHGVGRIVEIEKKSIGGNEKQYFRIDTSGGVYWLPVGNIPEYVRTVSSQYKFRKVLKSIREHPEELLKNYKERNRQISEKLEGATLEVKGELIRDLHARRYQEGVKLSALNERQLADLRQQFLREMSIVMEIDMEEAEERLDKSLNRSVEKLDEA
ncbi:MAG: hypothetical protein HN392_05070 [Anaerolineae bacterium]|jgi:CarD family transcriptional regulator|nr:hypothetical protein [Anaerolineae bacterium]MBT7076067.1 hypothetical protein [Anaerolineae bacterium]